MSGTVFGVVADAGNGQKFFQLRDVAIPVPVDMVQDGFHECRSFGGWKNEFAGRGI